MSNAELIAMAREPQVDDQAQAAGKYYALMVLLADALEAAETRVKELEAHDHELESVLRTGLPVESEGE